MSFVENKELPSNVWKISSVDGISQLDVIVCLFVELAVIYDEAWFPIFLRHQHGGGVVGAMTISYQGFLQKIVHFILQILLAVQGHSSLRKLHWLGNWINFDFMCYRVALAEVLFAF